MKNLSLALNGILFLAVIALYYMQFAEPSTPEETETEIQDEVKSEETKQIERDQEAIIGYVNIDSLQDQSKLYSELINKLKASQKRFDRELNSKLTAFEKKKLDFQKKAPTMSQFEGETRYKELMKEQEDLYQLRDEFAMKFQQEEEKLGKQFEDELKDFIAAYNEDKSYSIIIGSSILGNQVLYFDEGINVSNEVIDGLNEQYDKKNAKPTETKQ